MEKKQEAFCSLVEELLPLYQERSIGENTEKIIQEHLEHCSSCRGKNKEIVLVYQQTKTGRRNPDILLSGQEQEERGKFQALSKRLKKRKVRNACIGIAAAICFCMAYLMSFYTIYMQGDSMSPVIQDGDNCLISKVSYLIQLPQREDIVMLWLEFGGERELDLYRIVGIPGDEIEIADGHLSVNGKMNQRYEGIGATESYQINSADYRIIVPENQYFLLGDHYEVSYDSRYVGCVSREDIIGKYILTLKLPKFGVKTASGVATDGLEESSDTEYDYDRD